MQDNSRSVFARFSGFFLFLIALGVVGFLVFLTVRSAQDNSSDGDLAVTTAEATPNQSDSNEAPADEVAEETPAEEAPVASDDEGVVVAEDDDEGLSTVADEPVAVQDEDTSADSTDQTPEASDEQADEDQQVAAAQTESGNGEGLPNTGPVDTVLTVLAIAVVGALTYNYIQSKREVSRKLLGSNQ